MQNTVGSGSNNTQDILRGKRILLGVTGGIAAYKAAYLASALTQRGADVHVVLTQHASMFVGQPTFWGITRNPVITGLFDQPADAEIKHVSLSESADLLLIAPATANVIGKLANGIADDMLTTMALVVRCPIIIAPAMNANMYSNLIVVTNIDRLRQRGFIIVEAEEGQLACGAEGRGRLADPDKILRVVEETLLGVRRDYVGLKVVVTAGPTQEPIDPVRFISNRSSGKMGYAVADCAARRGARVVLISGPTNLEVPSGVEVSKVRTASEMFRTVKQVVEDADVLVCAAAPADFVPAEVSQEKIKKSDRLMLELDKAVDILGEIGKHKGRTVLVGFAAETSDLEKNATEKLVAKNLDLIVANDVSQENDVFGSDTNEVTLISKTGEVVHWPRMSKQEVANGILDYVRDHFLEGRR
ncbi:MAG: bifunctional phosphopantothenoylcysteine decarboxylase/phosphopantothenate--cysteine ligase CoaBC [Armatimonadota bacterium]